MYNNIKKTIFNILGKSVSALRDHMSRILRLSNFRLITTGKGRKAGYYSFKSNGEEICLDYDRNGGWSVYLCNKWEEVLDEALFPTIEEALEQANRFYQCLGKLDILYK